MSLWILIDVSGPLIRGDLNSLVIVPNEPILMKNQPTVPPVRSQPTVQGSASGDVQVATTSRMHTPQEVNLIAYFALPATFHIFNSILV